MENVIPFAFITVAAASFIGTIVYLVNVGRLFRRLESQHATAHESIGSPSLILNNTPRNNLLFFRWIWNREFESLDNANTIALARFVRSLLVGLILGFLVLIALFLAVSFTF